MEEEKRLCGVFCERAETEKLWMEYKTEQSRIISEKGNSAPPSVWSYLGNKVRPRYMYFWQIFSTFLKHELYMKKAYDDTYAYTMDHDQ